MPHSQSYSTSPAGRTADFQLVSLRKIHLCLCRIGQRNLSAREPTALHLLRVLAHQMWERAVAPNTVRVLAATLARLRVHVPSEAPIKFHLLAPHPHLVTFLLQYGHCSGNKEEAYSENGGIVTHLSHRSAQSGSHINNPTIANTPISMPTNP